MKILVILQGKLPRLAKVLAEGSGELEWMIEVGEDEYQLLVSNTTAAFGFLVYLTNLLILFLSGREAHRKICTLNLHTAAYLSRARDGLWQP